MQTIQNQFGIDKICKGKLQMVNNSNQH